MKYLLAIALLFNVITSANGQKDHNVEVSRSFDFSIISAVTSIIQIKYKPESGNNEWYYHVIPTEYAEKLIHIDFSAPNNGDNLKFSKI